MNFVFQIAIENAVLVALAAPLVWAVSRLVRRPALVHALWLIVLIKLVTPPVYRPAVPLPHRDAYRSEIAPASDHEPIENWEVDLNAPRPLHVSDARPVLVVPELAIDVPRTPPPPFHTVLSFETLI